jgi:hypothetical protein
VKIFFKRRNVKFVVESWKFVINYHKNTDGVSYRKIFLQKRLLVILRTIIMLTKILPLNSLFLKRGFDFSFDYEIETEVSNKIDPVINMNKMSFNNYSDSLGSISFEVEFLTNRNIFKTEEEVVKFI